MQYKNLLVVLTALSLSDSALGCGPSDNQYNNVANFGRPRQCLPSGYSSMQDKGQVTQAQLMTQCSAQCGAMGTACQFYFGQLECAPNGLCTGQCFYYPTVPAAPATCADYPTVIIGQAKDNTNKCFASSVAVATPFCSSYLSLGTVTSYTSTYTPTSRFTTTVASTVVSVCPPPPGKRKRSQNERRVIAADVPAQITASAALEKRQAAPTPSCLNTNSIPATRISSACSCLSITSTTLFTVSTAPTFTTTIPVTSTSTFTSPMYTSFNIKASVTGAAYPVGSANPFIVGTFPLAIKNLGNTVSGIQFYIHSGTLYQLDRGQYLKPVVIYTNNDFYKSVAGAVGLGYSPDLKGEAMTCSIAFSGDKKITCSGASRGSVSFKQRDYQDGSRYYSFVGAAPDASGADMTLFATDVVPGCYS